MDAVEIVLDVVCYLACSICAVTDLRKRLIYDWVTLPALGIGLVVRFAAYGLDGVFGHGLVSALFGAGFCFLVFGLFAIWGKGMGGGDVKLMAAVGSLMAFGQSLRAAMCTAIVGAALAVVLLIAKRRLLSTAKGLLKNLFTRRVDDEERIYLPYGLPIALGVLWAGLIKYGVLAGFSDR